MSTMKKPRMKNDWSRFAINATIIFCEAFLFMLFHVALPAQDFLPRFDRFRIIQTDTTNINFREIWLNSEDVNKDN